MSVLVLPAVARVGTLPTGGDTTAAVQYLIATGRDAGGPATAFSPVGLAGAAEARRVVASLAGEGLVAAAWPPSQLEPLLMQLQELQKAAVILGVRVERQQSRGKLVRGGRLA